MFVGSGSAMYRMYVDMGGGGRLCSRVRAKVGRRTHRNSLDANGIDVLSIAYEYNFLHQPELCE